MKKNLLIVGALIVAAAGVVIAGAPEMGKPRWFSHPLLFPAAQTIGAGGTIAADACHGIKRITATAARTTDTTNTFAAPSADNTGCVMDVVNVSPGHAITLDYNANFEANGGANVVLGASDTVRVAQLGSYWVMISSTNN